MIEQETWLVFLIVWSAFSSMPRMNIISRQCPRAYKMIIPYNHEPSIKNINHVSCSIMCLKPRSIPYLSNTILSLMRFSYLEIILQARDYWAWFTMINLYLPYPIRIYDQHQELSVLIFQFVHIPKQSLPIRPQHYKPWLWLWYILP